MEEDKEIVPTSLEEVKTVLEKEKEKETVTPPTPVHNEEKPKKRPYNKKKVENIVPTAVNEVKKDPYKEHSVNLTTALVYNWERERKERYKNDKWTKILEERLSKFEDVVKELVTKNPTASEKSEFKEAVKQAEDSIKKTVEEEEEKEQETKQEQEQEHAQKKIFKSEPIFGKKRFAPYIKKNYW